jgi:hypothetical protein
MDYPAFQSQLGFLLGNSPVGTTADIAQDALLYWDGRKVMGLRSNDQSVCGSDATFEVDEHTCNRLHAQIVAWMQAPHYAFRPELEQEISRSS